MSSPIDTYQRQADAYARICGGRIRAGRLSANLTQADLALACHAPSPTTIVHWEAGRAMPAILRQFAIADALAIPMPVLWGHTETADLALETILTQRGAPTTLTPTISAGVQLRNIAIGAHYLSNDCVHDRHGPKCRATCTHCGAPCRCWCHVETSVAVELVDAHAHAREAAADALDDQRWS